MALYEISLSEIKTFIAAVPGELREEFDQLSLVGLKTRLQLFGARHAFKSFSGFLSHFSDSPDFRDLAVQYVRSTPREVCRDCRNWEDFLQLLPAKTESPEIFIFESSEFSETITLLTALRTLGRADNARITVVDFTGNLGPPGNVLFSKKEFENITLNATGFENTFDIGNNFVPVHGGYEFRFDQSPRVQVISKAEAMKRRSEADFLVAFNLSLNYNYAGHQKYFDLCLQLLKTGGALFCGPREDHRWCSGFNRLRQSEGPPIYKKIL